MCRGVLIILVESHSGLMRASTGRSAGGVRSLGAREKGKHVESTRLLRLDCCSDAEYSCLTLVGMVGLQLGCSSSSSSIHLPVVARFKYMLSGAA